MEKIKVKNRYDGKVARCIKEPIGTFFVFNKGSSTKGVRYLKDEFEKYFEIIPEKVSQAVRWKKQVNKIVKCLNASGLWSNYLEIFNNLSKISYDDWETMKKIKAEEFYLNPDTKRYTKRTPEEMNALWAPYIEKYPFAFYQDEGNICIDTSYIYEMSEAKTKPMYFGKYDNAYVKTRIANALSQKEKYSSGRYRTSYDVSFEYDPSRNMAWYSEEYKDCGNGYYYIALDAKTALFIEKD